MLPILLTFAISASDWRFCKLAGELPDDDEGASVVAVSPAAAGGDGLLPLRSTKVT